METGIVMAFFLALAMFHDVRALKIPNWIPLSGTITALVVTWTPGAPISMGSAFAGALTALVLMLPFYAFRIMGAGDVKLIAMAGAFLGLTETPGAVATILVTGGVFSLVISISRKQLMMSLANIQHLLQHRGVTDRHLSLVEATSSPFAIAVEFRPKLTQGFHPKLTRVKGAQYT